MLGFLEQKINQLNDLFLDQCRLLADIKKEVELSKETMVGNMSVVNQMLSQHGSNALERDAERKERSRAKCLLDAIEVKQNHSLDKEISEALAGFLQSDELRERVALATAAAVRSVVRRCLSCELPAALLPALRQERHGLLRQATRALGQAFAGLEESSSRMSRDMLRACRQLRQALEQHQAVLEAPTRLSVTTLRQTAEALLDNELKEYRHKILEIISSEGQTGNEDSTAHQMPSLEYPEVVPASPPQPASPEHSIIDQLMTSALIAKQLEAGDVNGSLLVALCAGDLALVWRACLAAGARAFGPPCRLQQPVLLSLLQQLATDLVQDTHLKCRYLEETIISLDKRDPTTRSHLPLVVGDVRKHLTRFLGSYPHHLASRRVNLILMAVDNLLK